MFKDAMDWLNAKPPSLEELESVLEVAWRKLPLDLRTHCENAVITIEESPDQGMLDTLDVESPADLVCAVRKTGMSSSGEPLIEYVLFRQAVLSMWIECNYTLEEVILNVLHEEFSAHYS